MIVEGIGGPCVYCKTAALEFEIWLFRNRIEGITPAERRRGTQRRLGYTIIGP